MRDETMNNTTELMDDGSTGMSAAVALQSDDKSNTIATTCNTSSSSPLLPRILSGSIGSIVTALAVTPLEVVKIRQQAAIAPVSFRGMNVEPCRGCGTLVLNNGLMDCVVGIESTPLRSISSISSNGGSGTISTLLRIFRNEGYSGLYAGLRPTLVMSVPNTVLYFTAYDELSVRLRRYHANNISMYNNSIENTKTKSTHIEFDDNAKRKAYIPLLAGSTSRLLASLSTAPLELIRTRQASIVSSYGGGNKKKIPRGMIDEFKLLIRQNGVSSLYVGLAPTLWRDVPFSAIYWLFLERFKNILSDSNYGVWGGQYYTEKGMNLPPSVVGLHAFISGAGAGAIAAACTAPFDVVKTRRQMVVTQTTEAIGISESCTHYGLKEYTDKLQQTSNGKGCKTPGCGTKQLGTFGHMQQIIKQEGVAGLWKGNTTRMIKVAPACAIMISCYEFGKRVFGEVI